MGRVLEAVFEKGTFAPLEPVELPEGRRVSLSIEPLAMTPAEADAYLRDWRKLYEGLSDPETADLEAAILDRSQFSRPLDCWTTP